MGRPPTPFLLRRHSVRRLRVAAKTLIAALIIWASGVSGQAAAQYEYCNKSSYTLAAALGYIQEGALTTRGWWRLKPGECQTVLSTSFDAGRYFVYAEAIPGHRGEIKTWSGDQTLCIQNEPFFTLTDQTVCAEDPVRQRDFLPVEVTEEDDGSYTTEFTDENNFSIFDAEDAGVQRLLSDLGVYRGAIDGEVGQATRNAIRSYQRTKGMRVTGSVSDALMDALIEDANGAEAERGFVMCNSTNFTVWSAFAQPVGEDDSYRSSGWWRLDPQECRKVRRDELGDHDYYVYGVLEAQTRSRPMVGGDNDFCVAEFQFDAESDLICEDNGFERAAFRRVEKNSTRQATFTFRPEFFNAELAN